MIMLDENIAHYNTPISKLNLHRGHSGSASGHFIVIEDLTCDKYIYRDSKIEAAREIISYQAMFTIPLHAKSYRALHPWHYLMELIMGIDLPCEIKPRKR